MRTLASLLLVLTACGPGPAAPTPPAPPAFDAARLQTGRFRYSTTVDGADAGGSTIAITRRDAQTYELGNQVTGAFRQTWSCTATAGLAPLHATLGLGADDSKAVTMDLTYRGRHVTGTATRTSPADGTRRTEVAADLPADIVDQRIDWAALMSAPLAPGALRFSVYDAFTGVSPVTADVGVPEDLEVPAGRFRVVRVTYRIAKAGHAETYVIWVSAAPPRLMIREDFPDGATTQLVEILENGPTANAASVRPRTRR